MTLSSDLLTTVVFIGYEHLGKPHWIGTGFFVSLQNEGEVDAQQIYLVTAKHIVSKLEGKTTCIRVNTTEPGSTVIRYSGFGWIFHSDEFVDVAVLPWIEVDEPDAPEIVMTYIPHHVLLQKDLRGPRMSPKRAIGLGYQITIVGLFAHISQGDGRNIPIVRSGITAMFPTQKIRIKLPEKSGESHAYLIEARSIGGISGSPVFVHDVPEVVPKTEKIIVGSQFKTIESVYLLGLMHGHWDIDLEAQQDFSKELNASVNMGIAHVVPAYRILETIEAHSR